MSCCPRPGRCRGFFRAAKTSPILTKSLPLLFFPVIACPQVLALPVAPSGGASRAAEPITSALPDAPQPETPAVLTGTVRDASGYPVPGAEITVTGVDSSSQRQLKADASGHFSLRGIAAGAWSVTVSASGIEPFEPVEITLGAGEVYKLPLTVTRLPRFTSTVHVTATEPQIAQAQVKVEEQQRVLSVFPNFYTSYLWNAAPMTSKLKYRLAFRSVIDPVTFATTAGVAGAEQWHNTFPGYGGGLQGYGKRYGASYADTLVSRFVGGAILPSLFHQDPRYFYHGSGSTSSRLLYAIKESIMCRGDNGKQEVAYAHLLGNFIASGVSNLYRAPGDRQASLTFRNSLIITAADAADNVLREFISRGLTSHVPAYAKGKRRATPAAASR